MAGFIFGGDTGVQSAAELARRRKLVDALLETGDVMPRTFGEGLSVFGRAIAGKLQDKKLSTKEAAERARVSGEFGAVTNGLMGGAPAPSYDVPMPPPDPNSPHALGGAAMAALGKPPVSTASDPSAIRAGLVARGLPEHVADGFVMNMGDESGFNSGINEANPTVPGSRGGFGLYQLTGPRRVAYEKFAAERGVPVGDVDAQLDFLMTELQGPEKRAASAILSTKTAGEAGAAIVNEFLRPAEEHRASRSAAYLGGAASPSGGMDMAQLSELASNPYLPEGQRAVVAALMEAEMAKLQPVDPMDAIALEKAQLELNALKNPSVDPMAEIELAQAQLNYEQDKNPVAKPGYVKLTPEEVRAEGLPDGAYQRSPEGKIESIGGGGTTINNVMDGGGKFEEAFAKGDAATIETVYNAGLAAQRNLGRIDQLDALLQATPTGFGASLAQKAGEWGVPTEGLDEIQAAQAMINSLVPEQRQPGSGPMSDADLALFKQSLPQIMTQPGGNKIIVDTMRAVAEYDAEGARIVQRLRNGELSRSEAFDALQNRPNPLDGVGVPPPATNADPDADGWVVMPNGTKVRVKP